MPRYVTGLRDPSPRQCALGLQSSFRRNIAAVASRWLRFEPQTSLFSHKRVTARPTYGR